MSEHSKGPWRFEPEDYSMNKVYGPGGVIAHVIGDSAESEATAQLISAAPDLLEACKLAFESAELFNRDTDEMWIERKAIIQAAIAKAEGR